MITLKFKAASCPYWRQLIHSIHPFYWRNLWVIWFIPCSNKTYFLIIRFTYYYVTNKYDSVSIGTNISSKGAIFVTLQVTDMTSIYNYTAASSSSHPTSLQSTIIARRKIGFDSATIWTRCHSSLNASCCSAQSILADCHSSGNCWHHYPRVS